MILDVLFSPIWVKHVAIPISPRPIEVRHGCHSQPTKNGAWKPNMEIRGGTPPVISWFIRRPRPTQGGARQGIRHFPPTIWKLATATATATAAAAVLFCAMVFSRPGPTFLQQPAAGAAGRQQQSSQQSRSR